MAATSPDGRFPIGIVYIACDDETEARTAEDVLRADGERHELAESLLEALQREYCKQGKTIVSLAGSDSIGVEVEWERFTVSGLDRRYWYAEDLLWRDETAHAWVKNPGL